MIAEVCPPGLCAIENVSGSRIATPFAPPRPGSTPMMTPRMMPTIISPMFFRLSATAKPCISDWKSSITPTLAFAQLRCSQASSGPLGSGTRNQISKIRKKATLLPIDTSATFHQAYLPSQRMKNATNSAEAT